MAIRNKCDKETKLLLQHGSDVNSKSEDDKTPFHTAVLVQKNTEILELLLEKAADINSVNKSKSTPLHDAWSKEDNFDNITFLL